MVFDNPPPGVESVKMADPKAEAMNIRVAGRSVFVSVCDGGVPLRTGIDETARP